MLQFIILLIITNTLGELEQKRCCKPVSGKSYPTRLYPLSEEDEDNPFCHKQDQNSLPKKYKGSFCPLSPNTLYAVEQNFLTALNEIEHEYHKTDCHHNDISTARSTIKNIFHAFQNSGALKQNCGDLRTHIPYAMIGAHHIAGQGVDSLVMPSQRPIIENLFRQLNEIGQSTNTKILVFLELFEDIESPASIKDPRHIWLKQCRKSYQTLVFISAEDFNADPTHKRIYQLTFEASEDKIKNSDLYTRLMYHRNMHFMQTMTTYVTQYQKQLSGVISIHGTEHLQYFGMHKYSGIKLRGSVQALNAYRTENADMTDVQALYDEVYGYYPPQNCFGHVVLPSCNLTPNHKLCRSQQAMHKSQFNQQKRDWTKEQRHAQAASAPHTPKPMKRGHTLKRT